MSIGTFARNNTGCGETVANSYSLIRSEGVRPTIVYCGRLNVCLSLSIQLSLSIAILVTRHGISILRVNIVETVDNVISGAVCKNRRFHITLSLPAAAGSGAISRDVIE